MEIYRLCIDFNRYRTLMAIRKQSFHPTTQPNTSFDLYQALQMVYRTPHPITNIYFHHAV